jgi:hypothetical protein
VKFPLMSFFESFTIFLPDPGYSIVVVSVLIAIAILT